MDDGWIMHGLCIDYAWIMRGSCMAYVWTTHGLCMYYVWDYAWDVCGMSWNIDGILMEYVWNMPGLQRVLIDRNSTKCNLGKGSNLTPSRTAIWDHIRAHN